MMPMLRTRQHNIFGVLWGMTMTEVYHGVNTLTVWGIKAAPWVLLMYIGARGAPHVRVTLLRVK